MVKLDGLLIVGLNPAVRMQKLDNVGRMPSVGGLSEGS